MTEAVWLSRKCKHSCDFLPFRLSMLAQDTQQRPTAHQSAGESTQWQRWLSNSVNRLESANLLRTLHPVSTTLSPVEVCSGRVSDRTSTELSLAHVRANSAG